MDFFNKLKNIFTIKYKEFILRNYKKQLKSNVTYKNSTTKRLMNNCCSMEISSETELKKNDIKMQVKDIVKQYFSSPEMLIQHIKSQGQNVYKINKAEKILSFFGEEEGFITPLKGFKALLMAIVIALLSNEKISIGFNTKEMFVFDTNNTEIYTVARALFKSTGFKNNLPGYDYKSQEIFKKIYSKRNSSSPFTGCSIDEMYAVKDAMARDMESINFTVEISVEYENSKKAAKKLKKEAIKV